MATASQYGSEPGTSADAGPSWNQFSQYNPNHQMQLQFAQQNLTAFQPNPHLQDRQYLPQDRHVPPQDTYRYQYSIDELANDPSINGAALCYYQAERMITLRKEFFNKTLEELVTIAIREWNQKLTMKQKVKYLQMVERFGLAQSFKSNSSNRL